MSDPIFPLAVWQEGTLQNDVPANDNALRMEAVSREVLAIANSPGSTNDGDVFIVGSSPSGDFAAFDADDIAIYRGGTWYAWAPVSGIVVNVAGAQYAWDGIWSTIGGGGAAPVVTNSTTSLTADDTNAGNYTRFTNAGAKTYTFDDAETYTTGDEYHGRNVGAGDLTITEAGGMTINPPAGGTLVIPQGGTFTVKIVAIDEADLFGVTVPA